MIVGATFGLLKNMSHIRELLFLMLDTEVKEFMEGCQLVYLVLSSFLIIHDEGIKVLNKFLP